MPCKQASRRSWRPCEPCARPVVSAGVDGCCLRYLGCLRKGRADLRAAAGLEGGKRCSRPVSDVPFSRGAARRAQGKRTLGSGQRRDSKHRQVAGPVVPRRHCSALLLTNTSERVRAARPRGTCSSVQSRTKTARNASRACAPECRWLVGGGSIWRAQAYQRLAQLRFVLWALQRAILHIACWESCPGAGCERPHSYRQHVGAADVNQNHGRHVQQLAQRGWRQLSGRAVHVCEFRALARARVRRVWLTDHCKPGARGGNGRGETHIHGRPPRRLPHACRAVNEGLRASANVVAHFLCVAARDVERRGAPAREQQAQQQALALGRGRRVS
jgi:hypothetical protein